MTSVYDKLLKLKYAFYSRFGTLKNLDKSTRIQSKSYDAWVKPHDAILSCLVPFVVSYWQISNDGYFHLQIMWIDEALIANTQNKIKNSKKEVYISTWFVGKETTL